jgi:hypothetical protein
MDVNIPQMAGDPYSVDSTYRTATMGIYSSSKTHHQDVKVFVCVKAQLLGCKTMAALKHDGCIQPVCWLMKECLHWKRATMQKQS